MKKTIYLVWCRSMYGNDWRIWKTRKDARLAQKDWEHRRGLLRTICYIESYIGFTPPKNKIVKVTFKW